MNGVGQNAPFKETVKCSVGVHEGSSELLLEGTIGEAPGVKVILAATGIECLKHEPEGTEPGATIVQTGSAVTPVSTLVAEDLGRLKFTGVTVKTPANCEVTGGSVTTNPLISELFMDTAELSKTFDRFKPTVEGGNFAVVPIKSKTGVTCPVAGSQTVKGTTFGEAVNATGTFAVNQPLTFSSAIETTAGGTLRFAGNSASLTGRVNNELSGANVLKTFGAKEG